MVPFELCFEVDGLSITIASIGFLLWLAVSIYSISYIKTDLGRYYFLLLIFTGSRSRNGISKRSYKFLRVPRNNDGDYIFSHNT